MIGLLKNKYTILQGTLPIAINGSESAFVDQILIACAALTNQYCHIDKDLWYQLHSKCYTTYFIMIQCCICIHMFQNKTVFLQVCVLDLRIQSEIILSHT